MSSRSREVIDYSPSLADKVARSTGTRTIEEITRKILTLKLSEHRPTMGGSASRRAATRVKPEQASKGTLCAPTGVPKRVAMTVTGHKTRAVFDRDHIVSPGDLQDVAQRLTGITAGITGSPVLDSGR